MLNIKMNRKKSTGTDVSVFFVFCVIMGVVIALTGTIYVIYIASKNEGKSLSLSMIPLFAGLLFESLRINDDWENVIYKFLIAYVLGILIFIPWEWRHFYHLEKDIEAWSYCVLALFALISVVSNGDKATLKLSAGTTLLLSISFIYWLVDIRVLEDANWFIYTVLAIWFVFTLFSLICALTNLHLSETVRLWLSIWSTIVISCISIYSVFYVYSNGDIESSKYLSDNLLIGLQYFLLGVSAVYIVQNFMLLLNFLPSRSGNYRRQLNTVISDHINRYSDKQLKFNQSIVGVVYSCVCYYANYRYNIIPGSMMILFVLFSFSILLRLSEFLNQKSAS
jgi:hypothetical protein